MESYIDEEALLRLEEAIDNFDLDTLRSWDINFDLELSSWMLLFHIKEYTKTTLLQIEISKQQQEMLDSMFSELNFDEKEMFDKIKEKSVF